MFRLSAICIVAIILQTGNLSADIAPPPNMKNFFSMDKAAVRIHLKPASDGGVVATVEAEFVMLPTKKQKDGKTRRFGIEFPVAPKDHPAKVLSFSATVDGVKQKPLPFPINKDGGGKKLQTYYMWLCTFNVGRASKVVVKYEMALPKDGADKFILFYSLTSGAKWAGMIGQETVKLTAEKELVLTPKLGSPPPITKLSGVRLWNIVNSDPKDDIYVHVTKGGKPE